MIMAFAERVLALRLRLKVAFLQQNSILPNQIFLKNKKAHQPVGSLSKAQNE